MESKLSSSCLSPQIIGLSYMKHQKRKRMYSLYLPECSLGIATKDRTRCESKDHGSRGVTYVTG
jgi:hypothetical protein